MKQTDDQILAFLAGFLREDEASDASLAHWDKLKNEVESLIAQCNSDTDYPNKLQLRLNLDKALRQAHVFLIFPQLIGCHITCHLGLSVAQRQRLQSGKYEAKALIRLNEIIPVVYSNPLKMFRVGVFNHKGYADQSQDVVELFQQLKFHFEPAAIISCVALPNKGLANAKVVIDIPRNMRKDNPYFKVFLDLANEVVVHKSVSIVQEGLEYLQKTGSRAIVCPLPAPGVHDFSAYGLPLGEVQSDASIKAKAQFTFDLEIKSIIQEILVWVTQEEYRLKNQLVLVRDDLVKTGEDKAFSSLVKNLRNKANESIKRLENTRELMSKGKNSVLTHANEVHSILENIFFRNHERPNRNSEALEWNNWTLSETYFLSLFNSSDLRELMSLAEKMDEAGYPYTPVLNAYIADLQDGHVASTSLFPLLDQEDKALLHRAAIYFTDPKSEQALLIARKHAGEIESQTGKEWYFQGLANNRASDFRKALEQGYELAGSRLYEIAKNQVGEQRSKTLKFLAKNLVAEANYELGSNGKSNYEKTQLRIAAGLKYPPAIRKLAAIENNEVRLMLYQYLEDEKLLDSYTSYLFGDTLHQEKLFQQAAKVLEKSDEAEAASLLARMYHYGDGVSQDLPKAKALYENSLSLKPNSQVEARLRKVKMMIERRKQHNTSSNYSRSEKTTSSRTEKSSWCFLTTATCKVKGYGDDCDVLTVFRNYRDEVLRYEEGGEALISEYYAIAPKIVERIEQSENFMQVYHLMWEVYLNPCYQNLLSHRNAQAKAIYIDLVQMLSSKYAIST